MYDKIERIRNTKVQHGKSNDRVYVMKLDKNDHPQVLDAIEKLAQSHHPNI